MTGARVPSVFHIIAVWTDDRYFRISPCGQWQNSIILQQHDGFLCRAQRKLPVRRRSQHLARILFGIMIEQPQFEFGFQNSQHGIVDISLADQPTVNRSGQRFLVR